MVKSKSSYGQLRAGQSERPLEYWLSINSIITALEAKCPLGLGGGPFEILPLPFPEASVVMACCEPKRQCQLKIKSMTD